MRELEVWMFHTLAVKVLMICYSLFTVSTWDKFKFSNILLNYSNICLKTCTHFSSLQFQLTCKSDPCQSLGGMLLRSACAQSFAPWQQATIEITRRDHSIIACSCHIHVFLFFAHIPFMVNHTINATPPERLQQHPLLFTMNHTDRTFFVWRLNSARSPHPGHSPILLRSEIPNGMCAKLHTVAASNNRDHLTRSLYYCLFAPHTCIFVLCAHPVHGESHNQPNITGEVAAIQMR